MGCDEAQGFLLGRPGAGSFLFAVGQPVLTGDREPAHRAHRRRLSRLNMPFS